MRTAVAILVIAAVLWGLERRYGTAKRPRTRPELVTDLLYWAFTPLITRAVTSFAVVVVVVITAVIVGVHVDRTTGIAPLVVGSAVGTQPRWLQAIELFLLLDFAGYWTHRWFHRPRMWPFHAVHHSSRTLDWLAAVRLHPVNDLVPRVIQVALVLALGFDPAVIAGVVPGLGLYALLLHANVPWDFGPLRFVVASPRFHRWHHTSQEEGRDKNFAGLFPIWDLLFGTYYLPAAAPERFGVDDPVPDGLWGQLVYPLRRPPAPPQA